MEKGRGENIRRAGNLKELWLLTKDRPLVPSERALQDGMREMS